MTWSIWKSRNEWLFENKDPSVHHYKNEFSKELRIVVHRARGNMTTQFRTGWISGSHNFCIALVTLFSFLIRTYQLTSNSCNHAEL
jgi:hypothetical protein